MSGAEVMFFVLQSANPVAGSLVSVPIAVIQFGWHPLVVGLCAIPLCYLQVIAVDVLWSSLSRWGAWNRFLARKRSPRIERMVASRGAFASTAVLAPLVGPWLVMSFMRYAGVRQRAVALPILTGLTVGNALVTCASAFAPGLIDSLKAGAPVVGGCLLVVVLALVLVSRVRRRRMVAGAAEPVLALPGATPTGDATPSSSPAGE